MFCVQVLDVEGFDTLPCDGYCFRCMIRLVIIVSTVFSPSASPFVTFLLSPCVKVDGGDEVLAFKYGCS